MSAFKDAVQADVKAVFINLEEFAEDHNVNGIIMPCVVDKNILAETEQESIIGVFVNTITLSVATADLLRPPVEGEIMRLDGEIYIVRSVSDESGVLVIVLEANEQ